MATPLESRIDEILNRKVFPDAKAWCRAAKLPDGKSVSPGYLGTLKSRLRTGEVTTGRHEHIEALARAAGVTGSWLTGADEGPAPVNSGAGTRDPKYGEFTEAVRTRPGLGAALALEPNRWHMTTVLRAMAYTEPRFIDGEAIRWWTDLMDGVERSRTPQTVGSGAAVLAATLVQIDPVKKRRKK